MENEQFEEGQLVLCTVDKVIGTTVFVKIEGNGEGTINFSEIAPGRIRNIRDYVVPNKKIVCKILSIREGKMQLSLRRVKPNERKELLDKLAKENSYKATLKTAIGKEEGEKIIEKIIQEQTLLDFFEQSKTNPKLLEKYLNKEQTAKIIKILESKKEKSKKLKQVFRLSNQSSEGIKIIKKIMQDSCNNTKCNIHYLAAGKYNLEIEGNDFKAIKTEINKTLEKIEDLSRKQHSEFSVEKS